MKIRRFRTLLQLSGVLAMLSGSALAGDIPPDLWQDYQSQGWHRIGDARGDLNRDGQDDLAIVIEAPDGVTEPANACAQEDDYSDAPVRRLIVGFADATGGYVRTVDEPRVVLRADEGGTMGDPFEGVSIERGSVVLEFYGGSRWRWAQTLRFRYDDGAFRMAGMTDSSADSIRNSVLTYDYNALSGKVDVIAEESPEGEGAGDEPLCVACRVGETCPQARGCYEGTKPAKTGRTRFSAGKKARVLLSDFRCWENRTGLLAHTGFQSQK